MATKLNLSSKHIQINKANTAITAAVAIAAFITVASLMASRAMLQQRAYQSRVIKEKTIAARTLQQNLQAADTLVTSYQEFVGRPQNIINGESAGTGEKDGDNAKLTLDALPSKYDFPALTASLEKILTQNNFDIEGIGGTDDEVAQSSKESTVPEVIEMPFQFSVQGSYDPMYDLISILERSIRPIQVQKLVFTVSEDTSLKLNMEAKTFYQSEKTLNITSKAVK